jgi:predicted Zn-dependent protease
LRQLLPTYLVKAGKFQEALTEFDKALELTPGDLSVAVARMDCLCRLKRTTEALESLDALEKSHPEQAVQLKNIRTKIKAMASE